ncbi:T9SS type A sorting domain-containing protein [uncultured Draconibacterium sp.]|uniref:T9SS type A sorting domain-containing protein n=1 Tax=uncultured Draconibacterium sp. TaxID=1573823 RepID=UPI00325FEF6A
MKRFTNLILLLLLPFWLLAQPGISRVEYWYDGNYGTAMQQTVSGPSVTFAELLDVSSLEPGLHTVTFRFQDERGVWGSVLSKFFTYNEEALQGIRMITDVEFWYDGNYASAVETPLTSGASADWISLLDVSSLNDGLHTLSYRFKDDRDIWSSPSVRFFRMEEVTGLQQIVGLEYWFGDDYANKETSTFPPTSLLNLDEMLDVSSLAKGLHIVSVRLQDESGRWNAPACFYFTNYAKENFVLHQITELEYWFDNDYSSVQTDPVAATSLLNIDDQIDVSGLANGVHVVSCRFRDESGEWSPAYSVLFTKYPGESAAELHEITALEYWFDDDYSSVHTDPVANATVLSIDEQIDVSALSDGVHSVSSRYKDEAENWSPAYTTLFVKYLPDPIPDLREIVKVEYWIDGDYSQVNTESVASTGLLVIDEQLDVSALNKGLHTLTYRFGDKAGGWSSAITTFFSLYDNEVVNADNKIVAYRYWPDSYIALVREVQLASPVKSLELDDVIDLNGYPGGEHLISIQFLDSEGQWSSAHSETYTKEVIPSITISADDSTVCLGTPVLFDADITDADVIEWKFGDGSSSNEFSPEHIYTEAGVFEVSAIVTHTDSMKSAYDTIVEGIEVYPSQNIWLGDADTIFFSSFESDNLNSAPAGWIQKYYGTGTANQIVVNNPVKNGIKSFQMEGASGWASEYYRRPATLPTEVTLEAWVNCEKILSGIAGSIGVGNFNVGTWGTRTSRLQFYNGKISATYSSGTTYEIMDYTPGQWYHVKMIHDLANHSYQVFINNAKVSGTSGNETTFNFPMHPTVETIDVMLCAGNSGTTKMFFDDILLTKKGNFEVCETDLPYQLGSQQLTSEGFYTETLINSYGCDSVVSFNLVINPSDSIWLADTICEGDLPYTFGEQSLIADGIYTEDFPTAFGCDSVVTLTLVVNDTTINTDAVTICETDLPYTFGASSLTSAGIYTEMFSNVYGCDSTVTLTLTVNDTSLTELEMSVCENDLPLIIGLDTFYNEGVYTKQYNNTMGCDSTVILTLNVLDTSLVTEEIEICESLLPFTFGTHTLTASGVYSQKFTNTNGCDSTVILTLTVKDTFNLYDAVTVCENELPYHWAGDELSSSGTYTKVLTSSNGCDSTINLALTVNDTSVVTKDITLCESDLPYTFGSQTLNSDGMYTEVFSGSNGCDSTVYLTLNVNDTLRTRLDIAICEDNLPYIFGTRNLIAGGFYSDTLINTSGCDSIVELSLTVNDTFIVFDTVTICESELPYSWEGDELIVAGPYTKTLSTIHGCDSTVTLTLTVKDSSLIQQQVTICESELPYSFGSQTLTGSGFYTEVYSKENGCDSTVELTLNVLDTSLILLEAAICKSELPYILGTQSIDTSGIFREIFASENGCDSTIILTLTVNDTFNVNDTITICENELPYTFGSQTLLAEGNYNETFTTTHGCDSTVNLALYVNDTVHTIVFDTVCENDLPFTFGTQSLSSEGTYTETFNASNACDSVVVLQLTVHESYVTELNVTVQQSELPYMFWGEQLTRTGVYSHTLLSVLGCDSIITLNLFVEDDIPPSVQCQSINVVLSDEGSYTFTTSDKRTIAAGSSDNITAFENLKIVVSPSTFSCNNVGENTIVVQATDAAGNRATCQTKVNVADVPADPKIDEVPDYIVDEDSTLIVTLTGIAGGTQCEIWPVTLSARYNNNKLIDAIHVEYETYENLARIEIIPVTNMFGTDSISVTVQDSLGNTTTVSFKITVNKVNDAPVIIQQIEDWEMIAEDSTSIIISKLPGIFFEDLDDSSMIFSFEIEAGSLPEWINVMNEDEQFVLNFTPESVDTGCINIIVTIQDLAEATDTDTFKVCVNPLEVGISHLSESMFEINLYPNPTQGQVNINFENLPFGEIELLVTSISGSKILQKTYKNSERIVFDLSKHISGSYLVILQINNQQIVRKLILDKK